MAWTPGENTVDTGQVQENILAYLRANQEEALEWANGGASLKTLNFLSDSVAQPEKPRFPSLAVVGDEDSEVESDGDILETDYLITFESIVAHADFASVAPLVKRYARALKSMLKKISAAELMEGLDDVDDARFLRRAASYQNILANEQENLFFQRFQIKAVYRLTTTY